MLALAALAADLTIPIGVMGEALVIVGMNRYI